MGLFEGISVVNKLHQESSNTTKLVQTTKKSKHDHHPRQKVKFDDKPSDTMDLLITTMNDHDLGFKMDTCMLQKHHPRFGEGQECNGEG
jgi:hypothetical protein